MNLCMTYKDLSSILKKNSMQKSHGFFVQRFKLNDVLNGDRIVEELEQLLYKHDIYELPLDLHIELLLDNWRNFQQVAIQKDITYIFDCCFIQNPVTIGMNRI